MDNRYFYQGLEFLNQTTLLSSEGWYGKSNLALLSINEMTKRITRYWKNDINPSYFGEGATAFKGKIYQLTWQNNVVIVYSISDRVVLEKEVSLPAKIREGWGITHDDKYLYISNGSRTIFVCQAASDGTLKVIKEV